MPESSPIAPVLPLSTDNVEGNYDFCEINYIPRFFCINGHTNGDKLR